jgi:GNAT superfamily N-acetyltransferase
MFRKYHYLSGNLNSASNCYMAVYDDIIVGFLAVLSFPRNGIKHGFREHRLVIHPDYQGMGIGNKFSEAVGDAYVRMGCQYFAKTSNPRIGEHRDKSSVWRPTTNNHKCRNDYVRKDGTIRGNSNYRMSDEAMRFHANRVCYSHEYIGDGKLYEFTYKTKEQRNYETKTSKKN